MSESTFPKPKKLLDQLRDAIRIKLYSYATQKTYVHWATRDILFHSKRHPAEMGLLEIEALLSHLAQAGNVSSSTQNQAFNAILFLFRNVLKIELATPMSRLARQTRPAPANGMLQNCSEPCIERDAGTTPAHGSPAVWLRPALSLSSSLDGT